MTSWNQVTVRNVNNLMYTDDNTVKKENEELKSLFMRVNE